MAAHLADERFDAAVSSDLIRARSTAERIVRGNPALAVEPDARWREMKFGGWEGLTWPQIAERFPSVAAAPNAGGKFHTPPDGEAFEAVCLRVAAAVASLRERFPDGGTVLVATHAGALHALLRVALGTEAADALGVRFEPATVTRLRLLPGSAELVEVNVAPKAVPHQS